jgi:hypothetical protein
MLPARFFDSEGAASVTRVTSCCDFRLTHLLLGAGTSVIGHAVVVLGEDKGSIRRFGTPHF